MTDQSNEVARPIAIVQIVGVVLLFMTTGLGVFFMMRGNVLFTVIITALASIIMFLLVGQMWKLKAKQRNSGFGVGEISLLLFYVLFALLSYAGIFHGYNLQFHTKEQIIREGEKLGNELRRDLPYQYRAEVEEAIESYSLELNSQGKDPTDIQNDIEEIRKAMEAPLQSNAMDSTRIDEKVAVIENWKVLDLRQSINDLDDLLDQHISTLKEGFTSMSAKGITGWDKSFDYQRENMVRDVIADPRELMSEYSVNYFIPLIVWLFCHAMILIPYFWQRRGDVYIDAREWYT